MISSRLLTKQHVRHLARVPYFLTPFRLTVKSARRFDGLSLVHFFSICCSSASSCLITWDTLRTFSSGGSAQSTLT